ncbi:MAG TPA: hypothetical protein VGM00_13975 [Bradyrhizobium sp.]|jgi:hypothetical protein
MLQRTLAARSGGMKTKPDVFLSPWDDSKNPRRRKIFRTGRNNRAGATVLTIAAFVAFKTGFEGINLQ